MRIGILSTDQDREDSRLVTEGEARGHKMSVLKLEHCSLSVCPQEPKIYYEGKRIDHEIDAIIPRVNIKYTDYGLNMLRQFQAMDVYTTDTAYSIELGRDKMRCMQYLMRKNIPFPTTGFAHSSDDFDRIINTVGGVPLIIKLAQGTEGIGVFLAEDNKDAVNLLKTFKQLKAPLLMQEFIEESYGEDMRCFVVGGKVVASMKRKSEDQDFRANISLGGTSVALDITPEEEQIAIQAAEAIGMNIAGVDMVRSKRGPLVIEINVSPDFTGEHGLEEASGVNVGEKVIEHIEKARIAYDNGHGVWLEPNNVPDDIKKVA